MVRRKNLWFAILGFLCFWAGVGWAMLHEHIQKRADPPGWIIDRAPYEPALMLAKVGLVIFVAAMIIGIARLLTHGVLRLIHRGRSSAA